MTTPVTYSLQPYVVADKDVTNCLKCNKPIVWLNSYRTGNRYPVEVQVANGITKTCRNWFHKCITPGPVTVQLPLLPEQLPATYVAPARPTKAARRLAMRTYIEQASPSQLQKALEVIFNRQTVGEQVSDTTNVTNSVGFTGTDAYILSDICKKSQKFGGLRGRQVDLVRKRLKKYGKQLAEAMVAGEWTP